mmetsp:Transcript_17357/g.37920  ORF Transcript_17357/g.37920 Transcript_17357/m.37920 type:complete len:129 (+) Transcript_17357:336-722(+)
MKGTTSSSPSGLHLGHAKTIAKDRELARYRSDVDMIPFQHGFAPSSWKKIVECMIEKVAAKPHLGRLRQIALVESRYNTGLKILYSDRVMQRAEQLGLAANGQIGGKKGFQSIIGVMAHTAKCDTDEL